MVLMLDQVQDPGNVGAIMRAADACGATGVVVSARHRRSVRMEGAARIDGQRVPGAGRGQQPLTDAIERARRLGLQLLAAVPRDGTSLPACDLRRPVAVLLGGEGAGVSADLLALPTSASPSRCARRSSRSTSRPRRR